MEAYLLDETLLIEWEGRGPLLVLSPDRMPSECWQIPPLAEQLTTTSSVIEDILVELDKVKLSGLARATVEKLLDEMPR